MITLTVFTPTYNRKNLLERCYISLKNQTNQSFIWLIIDDGSSDNTEEIVEKWISEGIVNIKYVWKKNGGMHTAHNYAYELIDTTLAVCCDSDDFLAENAVELILDKWIDEYTDKYAGIAGLDAFINGGIVGEILDKNKISSKFRDIYRSYKGDKKYVYNTKIFKNYPNYPVFENEKFTPLSYKYFLIDDKYELLHLNEILCYVEYLEDGSTRNIFDSYIANPRGFIELRKVSMRTEEIFKYRFLSSIQYVMHKITLGEWNILEESPCKILTFFSLPLGLLWYLNIVFSKNRFRSKSAFTQIKERN